MNRRVHMLVAGGMCVTLGSCWPGEWPGNLNSGADGIEFFGPDVETRILVTNFSTSLYATMGVRDPATGGQFVYTPLLAPGATFRQDFLDFLGTPCPPSLDFRLLMYRRILSDIPIGLDADEAVEPMPVIAGELRGSLPACQPEPIESYSVGIGQSSEDVGRVRFAECTRIDELIRDSGIFPNPDNAWEVVGIEAADLADLPPPPHATPSAIRGRVGLADGTGVDGVVIVMRTLVRGPEGCEFGDDPDRVFSEPIAFTTTDESGAFRMDRPAGVYQLEFFSDDFGFRPGAMTLETPIEEIFVIAEPL